MPPRLPCPARDGWAPHALSPGTEGYSPRGLPPRPRVRASHARAAVPPPDRRAPPRRLRRSRPPSAASRPGREAPPPPREGLRHRRRPSPSGRLLRPQTASVLVLRPRPPHPAPLPRIRRTGPVRLRHASSPVPPPPPVNPVTLSARSYPAFARTEPNALGKKERASAPAKAMRNVPGGTPPADDGTDRQRRAPVVGVDVVGAFGRQDRHRPPAEPEKLPENVPLPVEDGQQPRALPEIQPAGDGAARVVPFRCDPPAQRARSRLVRRPRLRGDALLQCAPESRAHRFGVRRSTAPLLRPTKEKRHRLYLCA